MPRDRSMFRLGVLPSPNVEGFAEGGARARSGVEGMAGGGDEAGKVKSGRGDVEGDEWVVVAREDAPQQTRNGAGAEEAIYLASGGEGTAAEVQPSQADPQLLDASAANVEYPEQRLSMIGIAVSEDNSNVDDVGDEGQEEEPQRDGSDGERADHQTETDAKDRDTTEGFAGVAQTNLDETTEDAQEAPKPDVAVEEPDVRREENAAVQEISASKPTSTSSPIPTQDVMPGTFIEEQNEQNTNSKMSRGLDELRAPPSTLHNGNKSREAAPSTVQPNTENGGAPPPVPPTDHENHKKEPGARSIAEMSEVSTTGQLGPPDGPSDSVSSFASRTSHGPQEVNSTQADFADREYIRPDPSLPRPLSFEELPKGHVAHLAQVHVHPGKAIMQDISRGRRQPATPMRQRPLSQPIHPTRRGAHRSRSRPRSRPHSQVGSSPERLSEESLTAGEDSEPPPLPPPKDGLYQYQQMRSTPPANDPRQHSPENRASGPGPVPDHAGTGPGSRPASITASQRYYRRQSPAASAQRNSSQQAAPEYSRSVSYASTAKGSEKQAKKPRSGLFGTFSRDSARQSSPLGNPRRAVTEPLPPKPSQQARPAAPAAPATPARAPAPAAPPQPRPNPAPPAFSPRNEPPQRTETSTNDQPKKRRFSGFGSIFGRSSTTAAGSKAKRLSKREQEPRPQPQPPQQPAPPRPDLTRNNSSAYEATRAALAQPAPAPPSPPVPRGVSLSLSAHNTFQGVPPPPGGYYAPGNWTATGEPQAPAQLNPAAATPPGPHVHEHPDHARARAPSGTHSPAAPRVSPASFEPHQLARRTDSLPGAQQQHIAGQYNARRSSVQQQQQQSYAVYRPAQEDYDLYANDGPRRQRSEPQRVHDNNARHSSFSPVRAITVTNQPPPTRPVVNTQPPIPQHVRTVPSQLPPTPQPPHAPAPDPVALAATIPLPRSPVSAPSTATPLSAVLAPLPQAPASSGRQQPAVLKNTLTNDKIEQKIPAASAPPFVAELDGDDAPIMRGASYPGMEWTPQWDGMDV